MQKREKSMIFRKKILKVESTYRSGAFGGLNLGDEAYLDKVFPSCTCTKNCLSITCVFLYQVFSAGGTRPAIISVPMAYAVAAPSSS